MLGPPGADPALVHARHTAPPAPSSHVSSSMAMTSRCGNVGKAMATAWSSWRMEAMRRDDPAAVSRFYEALPPRRAGGVASPPATPGDPGIAPASAVTE